MLFLFMPGGFEDLLRATIEQAAEWRVRWPAFADADAAAARPIDDPHLHEDAVFGVKPDLIGDFRCADDADGRCWTLDFTFVMVRARPSVCERAAVPRR